MKIAYVLYPEAIVINKANGIRNQALKWAQSLSPYAEIDLISPWEVIDWAQYQAINFFGGTQWLGFVPDLRRLNDNVVFSPILDSIESKKKLKLLANLSFKGYHHPFNVYKQYLHSFKKILVRSQYEAEYISFCFGIKYKDIQIIPISYEIKEEEILSDIPKENFCLHVSALYQPRKNVKRLIEAANKFGFKLILCGNYGNSKQKEEIISWIGENKNIELRGFIKEEELKILYMKAKVFALPSINEGVGIVALNAAVSGCEIVLTNIGGPKEYFKGKAHLVNPYDVNEIGKSIMEAMQKESSEELKETIIENYSPKIIGKELYNFYKSL